MANALAAEIKRAMMTQEVKPDWTRRLIGKGGLDYYPTPPWATRALMHHVLWDAVGPIKMVNQTAWDPCAGGGHMVETLKEFCGEVFGSDINDYGAEFEIKDFLSCSMPGDRYNWVITNPPFKWSARIAERALSHTRNVALLCRLQWLASVKRYAELFEFDPPSIVAPFAERVHMMPGEVVRNSGSTVDYAWFVWIEGDYDETRLVWIPPCRKDLEKESDYERSK